MASTSQAQSSFPLSLRPVAIEDKTVDSLPVLIQRIQQERGQFRDVTEENLREELAIEASKGGSDHEMEDEEKAQTFDGRRKELFEARQQMSHFAWQAQQDINIALDFVCLLESRAAPAMAAISMSPGIKAALNGQTGNLGFDLSDPVISEVQKESHRLMSIGWNAETLGNSADNILRSARSLEKEMNKEAKYWEQVLSVSEKGWSLCRMQNQRHTIGVRFGFAEASSNFSVRGLAALKPDAEGNVKLDHGLKKASKCVRARIKRDNIVVASSRVPCRKAPEMPLEELIHQARDSLLEEELFYEMSREARELLSAGLKITDSTIYAPLSMAGSTSAASSNTQLILDLVPLSEDKVSEQSSNPWAESIVVALRLLMMNAYKEKLKRRSQPPPPLSMEKMYAPTYQLLRPIINHCLHDIARSQLNTFLHSYRGAVVAAGLNFNVRRESNDSSGSHTATLKGEQLIAAHCGPKTTTIDLVLATSAEITISLTTQLAPPFYGSQYRLDLSPSETFSVYASRTSFSVWSELHDFLIECICRDIAIYTAQNHGQWRMVEGSTADLRRNVHDDEMVQISVMMGENSLFLPGAPVSQKAKVFGAWGAKGKTEKSWDQVVEDVDSTDI